MHTNTTQILNRLFQVSDKDGNQLFNPSFSVTKCLGCPADWTPNKNGQYPHCDEDKIPEYHCATCRDYHPHDPWPPEKCMMCKKPVSSQCIKTGSVKLVNPCKNDNRKLQTITCSDKAGINGICKNTFLNLATTVLGEPIK